MMACHHDSDAMHLMRAAQVVRREMFESGFSFDGSFKANCQQEAVPPSLLALVNMILDGANIKHQTQLVHTATTKPALTISQLMVFNSVKHARNVDSPSSARHSRSQETPLPLYLSLKIHAVTRSRRLVDTLFNLGLCVSYDRLLQLTSDIANGQHRPQSNFCNSQRFLPRHRNLTYAASVTHTHGGADRGVLVIGQGGSSTKSVTPLPSAYTIVPPAALKTKVFSAPAVQGPVRPPNLLQLPKKICMHGSAKSRQLLKSLPWMAGYLGLPTTLMRTKLSSHLQQ
ncbi:hypothetical protein KUCAC02_016400 [Chaenocephalus aceratus]|nr:hypothetical protein KUCAC02_016400 [Chaenocephalus aceratus]